MLRARQGGSDADHLVAATHSDCGGAEEQQVVGVVVGKRFLNRPVGCASGGGSGAAKKVNVLEPQVRVMLSPVAVKTRGKREARATLPGAQVSGGERRHRRHVQVGGDSAGEAGADALVSRSRRNAVNLGVEVEQVVAAVSNSTKAEEEEEVGEAVDRMRKRKRKSREDSEHIVVSTQVGAPRRSTRSSGLLSAAPFVGSPIVEEKRGRMKAGDVKERTCVEEQLAEVQDLGRTVKSGLVTVGRVLPSVVESKRSRRKVQEEEPAEHKAAKVEISGRTTRSRSVAADVMSPIVIENKRRGETEDARSDGELPTVPRVPINDAPVLIRGLRNRVVQVNSSVVEKTHFGKNLENGRQPSKLATRCCMHQQLAAYVEEEPQEQLAAPCKGPLLRRSKRNHSEANKLLLNNNTTSESNNWSRVPEEGKDLKIARPSTRNAAKDGVEDGVAKADEHLELRRRNPQNGRAKGCGGWEEQVIGVVVRKGCLKRSGGGASSGSSGAAKKVTFVLEEHAEAEVEADVRGRPWVTWSPVVAKTRGRSNAGDTLPSAEVSGGECHRTCTQVGGDSVGEGDAGEASADAPMRWSRRNAVNPGASDGVEKVAGAASRNDSTKAEDEEDDIGEAVDRKWKTRENVEDIYISTQVGVSSRSMRSSVLLSKAAFLWSLLLRRREGEGRQET